MNPAHRKLWVERHPGWTVLLLAAVALWDTIAGGWWLVLAPFLWVDVGWWLRRLVEQDTRECDSLDSRGRRCTRITHHDGPHVRVWMEGTDTAFTTWRDTYPLPHDPQDESTSR